VLLADAPTGTPPSRTAFWKASGTSKGIHSLHRLHVVTAGASCAACHNAHGISPLAGQNARLVDFDVSVVKPGSKGAIRFQPGSCNLTCHNKKHDETPTFSY
jgi:hypothetical protein